MTTLSLESALAAACLAGMVGVLAAKALHPRRAPEVRMALYLVPARSHLDGVPVTAPGHALVVGEALRRVLGPLVGGVLSRTVRALGMTVGGDPELALRQAGVEGSPESYRREYLRWLLATPIGLGAAGAMTGHATYVGLFFAAGVVAGARRVPERLRARSRRRCERLRSDLPTVMSVLALKIENNKSLAVGLSDVIAQGCGPVVDDLARAAHLINAGYGDAAALELIAIESAEPAAARFYRLLSAAMGGGLDVATTLLDQANQLRAQRREEVERSAARRQMALVVPNLLFMAPVMFAFLLAPLPQLLFGR